MKASVSEIDLRDAMVWVPSEADPFMARALAVLCEEFESRAHFRLSVLQEPPDFSNTPSCPVICFGQRTSLAAALPWAGGLLMEAPEPFEGFFCAADVSRRVVLLAANSGRALFYAVGQFLRSVRLARDSAILPLPFHIASAPRWPLRGHQLGYRPLANSYPGWDVPQWERYIRDLVLWGANAVELLPPGTGGVEEDLHLPCPRIEMLQKMSRIVADYGMDVWLWYPVVESDLAEALIERERVLASLEKVDAVFVPAGDPGDTPLEAWLPFLEKFAVLLHRLHPQAGLWVSPQGLNPDALEMFFRFLEKQKPEWLAGVVFGPQTHIDPQVFRDKIPAQYPIRFYPDITHTRHCQYPVPEWDTAFALVYGREPICPRPRDMALILRQHQPYTIGAICYSEGCHDDVNKMLWLALSWNPEQDVTEILRAYGRFFFGPHWADPMAQGLLALEQNWRDSPQTSVQIDATLLSFQTMEDAADPHLLKNWRFLQPLFRAYCDAYTRLRLIRETALEAEALDALREASFKGAMVAMREAEEILDRAVHCPVGRAWRTRIFQLAEALYQTSHHKLSVPLYHAQHTGRGAHLDSLDWPLNSRLWLKAQFERIAQQPEETEQLRALRNLLSRKNPGPGGFYEMASHSRRIASGSGFVHDPLGIASPMRGFLYMTQTPPVLPYEWLSHAWTLNDAPLSLHYEDLDADAQYEVQVVYAETEYKNKIRLDANDTHEVHGWLEKSAVPLCFEVPVTREGRLKLTWRREPDMGGSGQGCHITEILLMRKDRIVFQNAIQEKWKFAGA